MQGYSAGMGLLSLQARHERRVQVVRLHKAGHNYNVIAEEARFSHMGALTTEKLPREKGRRQGALGCTGPMIGSFVS